MTNKILSASVVALVLLSLVVLPVLAVVPETSTYGFVWEEDLVDCRKYNKDYKFTIEWVRDITITEHAYFNQDGSISKYVSNVDGVDTFYNSKTGAWLSGNFAFTELAYPGDPDIFIHHGIELHITVPGEGIVFIQAGTIEYHISWEGGYVEVIANTAGPKDWTNQEYGRLCAALAD